MTTIFYLWVMSYMIYEIMFALSINGRVQSKLEFDRLNEKNKGTKYDSWDEDFKSKVKIAVLKWFFSSWVFVGMLSGQWIVCIVFLLFELIVVAPLSNLFKSAIPIYTFIHFINSILGALVCLFLIVNHYHLHIDTTQYIMNIIR